MGDRDKGQYNERKEWGENVERQNENKNESKGKMINIATRLELNSVFRDTN